jgi:hypothetical protein
MKLDQCHKQQRECGQEAKSDSEVLGKKKTAKAKHPPDHHQDLKLASGVCFENF